MDDVSPLALGLLQALHEAGPLHVGALAAYTADRLARPVSPGVVSRLMTSMTRLRWVSGERGQPSLHGGPSRLIYRLTASGERARKHALDQARRAYERLLFPNRLSEAARGLLQDPPAASAIGAAQNYGVDLTLLAKNASATPQERFDEALNGMRFLAGIRR